jgi:hypothetical protein
MKKFLLSPFVAVFIVLGFQNRISKHAALKRTNYGIQVLVVQQNNKNFSF